MINLERIKLDKGLILIAQEEAFGVLHKETTLKTKLTDQTINQLRYEQVVKHGRIIAMAKDVEEKQKESDNPIKIGTMVMYNVRFAEPFDVPLHKIDVIIEGEQAGETSKIIIPAPINYLHATNILAVLEDE